MTLAVAVNNNNPYGLKLLSWLSSGFSNLCYHKFRHNFQDFLNPICDCGLEMETRTNFLLSCPLFQSARQSLLIMIKKIHKSILKKHGERFTKTLLCGGDEFDLCCSKFILFSTIEFIDSMERFSDLLV